MDGFAKTPTSKRSLSLTLLAVLLGNLLFLTPANASIAGALHLLEQAQNEASNLPANGPSDPHVSELLNSARTSLAKKRYTPGSKGDETHEKTITVIETALSDLQNNDTSKAKEDIAEAILEVKADLSKTTADPQTTTQSTSASTPPTSTVTSNIPDHAVATVKLTDDQARAVVLIKGDNAEGTGFLIKTTDGPMVVTNIHVISNNPNLKITTSTGGPITILSYKGATDRDMVMIAIKDGDFKYLDLATDINSSVQPGDEVITPGNSEGGEVMLNTDGKVLGVGPDRIEFDNPIYHGNSGGPIIHVKSGKVIGVVTEAIKVDVTDELDKASFGNRNSAIGHSMRYFGFRLDNVAGWEPYDWDRFQSETAFLDQFDKRNRSLDCFLNAPDDNKPEDTLWRDDAKIVRANNDCSDLGAGSDSSQRLDAFRELFGSLDSLADGDMGVIQNINTFYSFDQQRARDEIAYRKALKKELGEINDNVSRMSGLARKSD